MLLALALVVTAAFASDPCKAANIEVDAFSDAPKVEYKVQNLSIYQAIALRYELVDGEAWLHVNVREAGAIAGHTSAGAEIPLKVGEETLVLSNQADNAHRTYALGEDVVTLVSYQLGLGPDALQALANHPTTMARVTLTSGQDVDWKPRGSLQKKLQAGAACMLQQVAAAQS